LLGSTDPQLELLDADEFCGHLVPADSIYRKLAELGDQLFSDADFADMYDVRGRHSIPPSLLAKVLLLQTFEGTSDRDALHKVRCEHVGGSCWPLFVFHVPRRSSQATVHDGGLLAKR
jgi:hypothetical protein